ncbi:MAG: hypothetical protein JNK37_19630 [Verrucomicrobiales bacterium]|nr:hypothetical protein [Verrucomicrobiales bacterium]
MIEYNLSEKTEGPPNGDFSVRVIGVGGAGANVLDRMALEGSEEAELLTLNTDIRALSSAVSNNKIQLGKTLLKGMGAGGDPDLGKQAALEAVDDIRASLRGHQMAFVCVGLGGGTGSGAAPEVCRIAKEEGVFLVVFATMPFSFEGKRRMDQAIESLDRIGRYANAVVTFDNDRMGELIVPKEGVQSAFAAADKIISQSIRATMKIVSHPGIIRIGMDELLSALRNDNSRCLFGFGVAKGDSRALEAFEQAMKSPLLDRGRMLEQARNVLVHVGGGDSMTLYEIELVMQELSKHIDSSRTQILFGTGTDKKLGGNLTVTIISSLQGPGGQGRDAVQGSSYQSPEPEPPAPRLGSPLMAPASPTPAVTPEPDKNVEKPVNAAVSAEKQQTPSSQPQPAPAAAVTPAPQAVTATPAPPRHEPAPVAKPQPVEAPARPAEPVAAEPARPVTPPVAAPAAATAPAPQPVAATPSPAAQAPAPVAQQPVSPAPAPVAAAPTPAPAPVAATPAPAPVAQQPVPPKQPEPAPATPAPAREPVDLQPVRKTAPIQAQPVRRPALDVGTPVSRQAPVVPVEPVAPAKPAERWSEDDVPDTIGKMLAAGLRQEPDPDQTVPILPPRTPVAPREVEGEVVVAQTGDAQKISLSRLVPGSAPAPEEVMPGTLGAAFGLGLDPLGGDLDAAAAAQQQMLQLEPLSKGRFAKTEPTIVDGEDMDVPTFLRKRRK